MKVVVCIRELGLEAVRVWFCSIGNGGFLLSVRGRFDAWRLTKGGR